jgi:hypothetical protein
MPVSDSDEKKLKDLKSRLGLVAAGRPAKTLVDPPKEASGNLPHSAGESPTLVGDADPVTLEPGDLSLDVATSSQRGPLIAVVLVLVLVALGVGYFLGGTFADRNYSKAVNANMASVKSRMGQKDGETGKTSFETIAAHKAAVAMMEGALSAYEASAPVDDSGAVVYGGEITQQMVRFLDACAAYRERVELGAILPDGLYGKYFLGPALRFSSKANQLADATQRLSVRKERVVALSETTQANLADPGFGSVTLLTQEAVDEDGVTWSLGTLLKGVTLKPRQGTHPNRRPGQPRIDWLIDIPGKDGATVVAATRQIVEVSVKSEILRPVLEQLQVEWHALAQGIHALNGVADSVAIGPFSALLDKVKTREEHASF